MSWADSLFFWAGVAGVCLLLARQKKGWLFVMPAITHFVWPMAKLIWPILPWWFWIGAVALAPVLAAILALRVLRSIITLIFDEATASHFTAGLLLRLIPWRKDNGRF